MGTVIAPRLPRCASNAKTSERERAGYKRWGSRGLPRRSFLRLSPEKAGLLPGIGRKPTLQVLTCATPEAPLPIRQRPRIYQTTPGPQG